MTSKTNRLHVQAEQFNFVNRFLLNGHSFVIFSFGYWFLFHVAQSIEITLQHFVSLTAHTFFLISNSGSENAEDGNKLTKDTCFLLYVRKSIKCV